MNKVEYKNTLIKDIGRVVTGKTPETQKAEFYGNGYMFITPAELHDGYNVQVSDKCITEAGLLSVKSNCVNGTSVMVGCIGWDMGNVAICHRKCATNQQINSITDFNPRYNPFYTYYWLLTKKDYLFTIASVTRTPILSKSTFEEIVIPMPDRSIQDNVVGILKPIDDMIENNKRIGSELEDMAKTLYDYWFTQFDFPNAEGKPYRASGGKMVWNEQLKREIPEKWDVGNLYSIANPINGLACQKYRPSKGEKALPVVKIKEMYDGITAETEKVSVNIPGKNKIHDGDILFSWSATLEVMYWFGGDAGLNQHIFKVEPVNGYSKEYVYHQFAAYVVNFVKVAESRKTTMGHITTDHLEQSRIVLPPADIIQAFSRIVGPIHRQIGHCKKENRELSELRDWLIPMLMNGQATVADAKEEVSKAIPYAPQTVEVRQAARNFGDTKTDDTADLVQAYLRRKRHDSKT